MTLTTDLLAVDRPDERIAWLTLQRPGKRNALSVQLRDDMSTALEALAVDDTLSVVVIAGSGAVFSAGFDLTEFDLAAADPAFDDRLWESSNRWHDRLRTFPAPTIAAVNGPALAGGFDLATMCDLRVASRTAYFARPEVKFSPAIYSILRDLVGGAFARELTFTGRRVEVEEALARGLVTRVCDDADLHETTLALAREIAEAPRDALRTAKASVIAAAKVSRDAELAW